MNSRDIVQRAATDLLAHRHKLAGDTGEADRAKTALETTAKAVAEHRDEHRSGAATATSHWNGTSATAFDRKAKRLTTSLDVTATAATRGAGIVAAAAASVAGNRVAVERLIEEYTAQAAHVLDLGLAAKGAGAQAAMHRAVLKIRQLMKHYTAESAKHVSTAEHELRESAKQLKALERDIEHDGIVDPKARHKKPEDRHKLQDKITHVAKGELGYREGPGNRNKYGPAAAWCSSFASWVWQKSGVDIPITPFTGNMYHWGQQHHLAYGNHQLAGEVRPGDVLLFGTGPQNTNTSKHIGIVESVHGNQVTLIEGNSGDRVQRVTHALSPGTFYGGVHPR